MEFVVSYNLENEQQFWDELDDIVSVHCQTHELIDSALQSYLLFVANYQRTFQFEETSFMWDGRRLKKLVEYLRSDYDVARCCYKLLGSSIYTSHRDYVRYQILHTFLQEDNADNLYVLASFLLFDGRQDEETFKLMEEENVFPRLVELLRPLGDDNPRLTRMLLDLLYEMSRIQRIELEQLSLVDDNFVMHLFDTVERGSEDASDPYNTPTIRVLLVLNEQYMIHSSSESEGSPTSHLTNKVLKVLSYNGHIYKTFGENIIYLLNRESETSMQLLILKLLYLMCTTSATYEYFYTNDLHVLVDVILRNLIDLPSDSESLRHTYLRVLFPLLSHTQLNQPPHYKAADISRILGMLAHTRSAHFQPVDPTTLRLVTRCLKVEWLGTDPDDLEQLSSKRTSLGMTISGSGEQGSSLSVSEVAELTEKPGVITPSRKDEILMKQQV